MKTIHVVIKVTDHSESDYKEVIKAFVEYKNAISYVNSLESDHKVSYDIDEIEIGDW